MRIRCDHRSPDGLRHTLWRRAVALRTTAALLAVTSPVFAQTPDGKALFTTTCASCHNGAADSRAPSPEVLRRRSPDAIMTAMGAGAMRPQASHLTGAQRRAVAEYVTGKPIGGDVTGSATGRCTTTAPPAAGDSLWNGWGIDTANTRFQPSLQAGLTALLVILALPGRRRVDDDAELDGSEELEAGSK